jgi:hypothetical protein
MTKWILEIPALHKVEKLARQYAHQNPELAEALAECVEARKQAAEHHQNALVSKGWDCTECGKRFIPLHDSYNLQCSIGCQFKAKM